MSILVINSCNKENKFGVLVAPSQDIAHLEGEIFKITSQTKSNYTITHTIPLSSSKKVQYTVPHSTLVVFDTLQEAILFQEIFAMYVGTHMISSENIIVHSHPSINSSRVGVLEEGKTAKIIAGIVSSEIEQPSITSPDTIIGTWIKIQTTGSSSYIRGWVAITEHSYIKYETQNELNASLFVNHLKPNNYFILNEDIEYLTQKKPLDFNPTILTIENNKSNTIEPILRLHQEEHSYYFPTTQFWPLDTHTAIIPHQGVRIHWTIQNNTISNIKISFIEEQTFLFQPIDKKIVKQSILESIQNKAYTYSLLTTGQVKNNQTPILWRSDLFGTIHTTAVTNQQFEIASTWYLPKELSQLYFPKNTTKIEGIIMFTHILDTNVESEANAVLTFYVPALKQKYFLAITIVNDKEFILQFIPEANVLTDTSQSHIISAPPAPPKMFFTRSF